MGYYDLQTSARFVQGAGVLQEIKRYTYGMGKKFLVLTACKPVNDYVYSTIQKSFDATMEAMLMPEIAEMNFRYNRQIAQAKRFDAENKKIEVEFMDMDGKEVTEELIQELREKVKAEGFDCVVGIGGGKGMDIARAVAYYMAIRVVLVPTVAATNASASPLCVLYNKEGTKQTACYFLANYQDLVIADTNVLIHAPARTLVAGIGDQLCTYLEVKYTNELMKSLDTFPELSWHVIDSSCDVFMKKAKSAYEAAKKGEVTQDYEDVLHQVLFSNSHMRSAACSGFSHLLAKALIQFPEVNKKTLHGEQVSYCIIPMMVHQQKSLEEIHAYIDWCRSLDIPLGFENIGMDGVTEEQLLEACRNICAGPTLELPYTPEILTECLLKAEEIIHSY